VRKRSSRLRDLQGYQIATILVDRSVSRAADAMPAKKKTAKVLRCPSCGMLVRPGDEDFPFCSDRCRKIDLGKWASGAYKISSPVVDPEVLEDLDNPSARRSSGGGGGSSER
jgi:uncharacterized protein